MARIANEGMKAVRRDRADIDGGGQFATGLHHSKACFTPNNSQSFKRALNCGPSTRSRLWVGNLALITFMLAILSASNIDQTKKPLAQEARAWESWDNGEKPAIIAFQRLNDAFRSKSRSTNMGTHYLKNLFPKQF